MSSPAAVGASRTAAVREPTRRRAWPVALGGLIVAIELAWIVLLGWAGLAIVT